ncbi:hypothetical protein [Herbaspirillum sp.]|uniref:hypothetical protein n=1 Tax=Herbaspirillum sp. TaxID=1890675 RepID=UPI000C0B4C06|nr:hypothetical protein [Herbaspirillum sp.]MAF04716.1 hypothetical protein [Herbaspirillum sp.]|tara:strand:- start:104 stop:364 length:261 start_codon:yes stop_codon:yes gene_type:complete
MEQENVEAKSSAPKKKRTIEEEIALKREQLKELERKYAEIRKKAKEKNIRAVTELLGGEGLFDVTVEQWKERLPEIKKALGVDASA